MFVSRSLSSRLMSSLNPFLSDFSTFNKFGVPPFTLLSENLDSFLPAFEEAMKIHKEEMNKIANSSESPNFVNTVVAWENAGRLLEQCSLVLGNLTASHSNEKLQEIERTISPVLALHHKQILIDSNLYNRVKTVLNVIKGNEEVKSSDVRLVERLELDMVRSGVCLSADQKTRMSQICERQAALETNFSQNVLHHESNYKLILDQSDLAGLPQSIIDSAKLKAEELGLNGKFVFTLSRSSVEPFLCFSEREDLRESIYNAWVNRGAGGFGEKYDNRPIIRELVKLRMEEARLLGYSTYAKFKLENSMAATPEAVLDLLNSVWKSARSKAFIEKQDLIEVAKLSKNDNITASSWRFYSEKVRATKYNFDSDVMKPYFLLENMIAAAFDTAHRLFGINFVETAEKIELYHPDVRVYEVRMDNDTKDLIGIFLHDNFARSTKRSGAWMSVFRSQEAGVLPIVINNNNFCKGTPHTLLDFDDCRTLFHEFGHGLHGLLSQCQYRSQAGTAVLKDFLEFPSQMMEHWAAAPEVLRRFARHAVTNEIIPEEMLQTFLKCRNFDQGFGTTEYLGSALFDLAIHSLPDDGSVDSILEDPVSFENECMSKIEMLPEIGSRHRCVHFQHLFTDSSYAAGYYVYIWANTLDCDGFEAFKEINDVFDPKLAAKLKTIYSSGDTRHPMDLYRDFRGRNPEISALLRDRELPLL